LLPLPLLLLLLLPLPPLLVLVLLVLRYVRGVHPMSWMFGINRLRVSYYGYGNVWGMAQRGGTCRRTLLLVLVLLVLLVLVLVLVLLL
jgi:hypothetical protein